MIHEKLTNTVKLTIIIWFHFEHLIAEAILAM
uniref:Uncharacterized protein n=1 Tax=Anguilla anguilla TaxID=7936 RepID=A0A0E9VXU5_ANGAN